MLQESIIIKNPTGLHLRPASKLCTEAMKYKCRVNVIREGTVANAKSVLSVLGACIKYGDEITLVCDGEDEEQAFLALTQYIKNGIGE